MEEDGNRMSWSAAAHCGKRSLPHLACCVRLLWALMLCFLLPPRRYTMWRHRASTSPGIVVRMAQRTKAGLCVLAMLHIPSFIGVSRMESKVSYLSI